MMIAFVYFRSWDLLLNRNHPSDLLSCREVVAPVPGIEIGS